jgi:hypothetical protein
MDRPAHGRQHNCHAGAGGAKSFEMFCKHKALTRKVIGFISPFTISRMVP